MRNEKLKGRGVAPNEVCRAIGFAVFVLVGAACSDSGIDPVISEVAIVATPTPATAGSQLECTYSFVGDDGAADDSLVRWTVGGAEIGTGSTITSGFARDDTVTCTVTAMSGDDAGNSDSAEVTIGNAAPQVGSAEVVATPSPATAASVLTCSYVFQDADSDTDSSIVSWTVNGTDAGTGLSPNVAHGAGDLVQCSVQAGDGIDVGNNVEASVTVENAVPVAQNVVVNATPSPANRTSTLTCGYTFVDGDGDPDNSSIAWTVDGVDAGSGTTPSLSFVRGNVVRCTVTPSDGAATGAVAFAEVTIGNAPPSVSGVTVTGTPTPVRRASTLDCSFAFTDPDSDGNNATRAWTINETAAGTGGVPTGIYVHNDVVRCTVTANDGMDDGNQDFSEITIANTAPNAATITLSPESPSPTDDLTCTISTPATDDDNETIVSNTYSWERNGAAFASSDATILAANVGLGEMWQCFVTSSDGTDSATASSPVRTVNNAMTDMLTSVADASMYAESNVATNPLANGGYDGLHVGVSNSGNERRAMLYFDVVGTIPLGSTVSAASLEMQVAQGNGNVTADIHRLSASFNEGMTSNGGSGGGGGGGPAGAGDSTWNCRAHNGLSGGAGACTTSWTAGADFSGTVSASLSVPSNGAAVWSGPGLIADVQSWIDGGAEYGWIVRTNGASSANARRFNSRENGTAASRPILSVTYEPPRVTFEPVADASFYAESADLSNGAYNGLFVGMSNAMGGSERRAVLRFDLSSIPSNGTIVNSFLVLWVGVSQGSLGIDVHRMTRAFNEGAVNSAGGGGSGGQGGTAGVGDSTWNCQAHNGGMGSGCSASWTTAGGEYVGAASATVASVPSSGRVVWTSAGLASDVQNWVDGTNTNDGWILVGDAVTVMNARAFSSRESPTASLRPSLIVNYTTP